MLSFLFPVYFISLALSAGMTLLSAYQILELSDLDCDHINPQRCCANLNKLVLPELICIGIIVALHSATLNWYPIATTLPMLTWLIYIYKSTPRGYTNLFDPTSICDKRILKKHVHRCFFKVAFYLTHFVGFMYYAINSLVKD